MLSIFLTIAYCELSSPQQYVSKLTIVFGLIESFGKTQMYFVLRSLLRKLMLSIFLTTRQNPCKHILRSLLRKFMDIRVNKKLQ